MRIKSFILLGFLLLLFFLPCSEVLAKRPPETRNQEQLEITQDMHGKDLNGYEFVKTDLRGIDLSESNLTGAVFNNSQLQGTNLRGSDMEDVVAFATEFQGADLSDVNFTNALLMESVFEDANIDGADFTDAVLSRIQQKQLCSLAQGTNTNTGIETSYSLGC